MPATLPKSERLSGLTRVTELFTHGKSGSCGCIRYRFLKRDDIAPSRIVVSVPKRNFKRAVKRNLLKRRLRESYRLQKDLLGPGYDILFIYTSRDVLPFDVIIADMAQVLTRVAEVREMQGADTQEFGENRAGDLGGSDLDK